MFCSLCVQVSGGLKACKVAILLFCRTATTDWVCWALLFIVGQCLCPSISAVGRCREVALHLVPVCPLSMLDASSQVDCGSTV